MEGWPADARSVYGYAEPLLLEVTEVGAVGCGKLRVDSDGSRGDHAIEQAPPSAARLIEKSSRGEGVILPELDPMLDDERSEFTVCRVERTAQKLCPRNATGRDRLGSIEPGAEGAILAGPVDQCPDQEARVGEDQRVWRSFRTSASHRAAAALERPTCF